MFGFNGVKEVDGHPTKEYVAWLEAQVTYYRSLNQQTPHVRPRYRNEDDHLDYADEADERY